MTRSRKAKIPPKAEIRDEKITALRAFAARYGRRWKSVLLSLRQSGQDWREPEAAFVRQVRNAIDPSALYRLKLSTETAPELSPPKILD